MYHMIAYSKFEVKQPIVLELQTKVLSSYQSGNIGYLLQIRKKNYVALCKVVKVFKAGPMQSE